MAQQAQQLETKYVDIPELAETFADHIENLFFDGATLRVEFCVKRIDQFARDKPATGRRLPVCRLVLPREAAIELINQLQRLGGALEQQGLVKRQPPPAAGEPKK